VALAAGLAEVAIGVAVTAGAGLGEVAKGVAVTSAAGEGVALPIMGVITAPPGVS
jgi:hypothetical protein